MRIVVDATPLLGARTGVGRYTDRLLAGLAAAAAGGAGTGAVEVAATAFTWRGLGELPAALPPGVGVAARRAPARLLQEAWARGERLPVEWLTGDADVVHGTNFVLPPLRRAAGVLTIHDLSYLRTPDTVSSASARYTELVPRGLRRAAVVLTPSRAVADEVVAAYRVDEDKVVVTPLGVDDAWFAAVPPSPAWLAAHGLPERYLLFVGTPEPRKNLPLLLEALRVLHASAGQDGGDGMGAGGGAGGGAGDGAGGIPPLVLVGPPGWGPALDVGGLPPGAVTTAGYLADEELRNLVAGAVALCFPSRYEGFGLPPLEAMAAGTPVVAADIPAVREVVGPASGKAARLVPPSDADAFADALRGVFAGAVDPAAGRARARMFAWRRTAELTLAAYRRAAS
jgi:glycosyltransferase involved in cell wall biosynthesis